MCPLVGSYGRDASWSDSEGNQNAAGALQSHFVDEVWHSEGKSMSFHEAKHCIESENTRDLRQLVNEVSCSLYTQATF